MSRRLIAAMMALASASAPGLPNPLRLQCIPKRPPPGPRRVDCPKCGAVAGEPCDRRTLGRHPYHLARVEVADGE